MGGVISDAKTLETTLYTPVISETKHHKKRGERSYLA